MFRRAQILNSSVWKSQNPQFQSLEKTGTSIEKAQNPKFYCLEKPTSTIPMLGKD